MTALTKGEFEMIDVGYFLLFWFFGTFYMFTSGAWKEFGDQHPRIAIIITVFGGIIVSALIKE